MNLSGSEVQTLQDVFVGREAIEDLEPAGEVVGREEVAQVSAQLTVAVVMEAFYRCLLDCSVHPFDLTIGPGMVDLGEPVLDAVLVADAIKDVVEGVCMVSVIGELDAVVGKHRMQSVGNGHDQITQELGGCHLAGLFDQAGEGELAGPVDGHKAVELALSGLDLSDADVKEPNGIAFEALPLRLVALDIGQAGNTMPLKAAVQRRAGQVRDRRLQAVEAIVQRQQGVPPERDHHRLLHLAQNGRAGLLRSGLQILDCRPLAPLGHCLRIDAKLAAQHRERSLRSLYCCSDGVRGRGAPVTNLSHRASFHSVERIAPSNCGIKHLAYSGVGSVPVAIPEILAFASRGPAAGGILGRMNITVRKFHPPGSHPDHPSYRLRIATGIGTIPWIDFA